MSPLLVLQNLAHNSTATLAVVKVGNIDQTLISRLDILNET